MNNIIIELCAEDRARLDRIAEALDDINARNRQKTIIMEPDKVTIKPTESTPAAPQSEPAAEPVQTPAEEPKAKEEPKAPTVSVAELQAKVVELVSAGKRDAVKAIVNEYAERVGDIPEDKRHEAMQKLEALEG
jgi:hypothetical protein